MRPFIYTKSLKILNMYEFEKNRVSSYQNILNNFRFNPKPLLSLHSYSTVDAGKGI